MTQLVEENDYWRLFCENCNHEFFAASHTEREKMIQGMELTEKYTPGIINAYKYVDKDTPSRISFGRIQFEYNLNYETRDTLLKLDVDWEDKRNRVIKFEPFRIDILESLINQNFINVEERQNGSPTVEEMLEFMRKYPVVYVYGYAVTPKRWDYRVSLEGMAVNQEDVTDELKEAFLEFCKTATELHTEGVNGLLSWWE